jgi:two-component system, OmpR family, response regulator MprA
MAPHILIAEDYPGLRDALRLLLESEGYQVTTAADGEEALDAVLRLRPDALLTDIDMPRLTGWELRCRVRDAGVTLPVLFMSADPSVRTLAVEFGAVAALVKPFSFDDLFAALCRAVRPAAA